MNGLLCQRDADARSGHAPALRLKHVLGTTREGPERHYEGRHEAAALASREATVLKQKPERISPNLGFL